MNNLIGVRRSQVVLLLAAAMVLMHSLEASSYNLANERSSIERTYELTKYLEHQLKEIKDTYLSYLGPPFNEKDFSPPRPNSTALSLPSAATRLELWRGLENRARLAQNQRAYSVLLAAVRELARSTLCPYLQTSLLHFCTGLDGLLVSISGLMTGLGYPLPPPSALAVVGGLGVLGEGEPEGLRRPAPLMMSGNARRSGSLAAAAAAARDDLVPLWALSEEEGSEEVEERGGREEPGGGRRRGAAVAGEKRKGKDGGRRGGKVAGGKVAGGGGGGGGGGRRNQRWRERTGSADGREERGGRRREAAEGERRGRRGRRGAETEQRGAPLQSTREAEEAEEEEEEAQRWGQRRRLLSVEEEVEGEGEEVWDDAAEGGGLLQVQPDRGGASPVGAAGSKAPHLNNNHNNNHNNNNNNNNNNNDNHHVDADAERYDYDSYAHNQYSYNLNFLPAHADTARMEDAIDAGFLVSSSSSSSSSRRHARSLPPSAPTLRPPSLSALSFFYPLGMAEGGLLAHPQPLPVSLRRGTALLSSSSSSSSSAPFSPMLSVRPALSDFARKVEGFWILRELQSWLWRSAKDFNRLKKRLRG